MIRIVIIANLITYSITVSQPLAYLVFLSKAQGALSAQAYIELRQRINPVMTRRLPVIYLSTLATVLLLLAMSLFAWDPIVFATTSVALLCLVIDVIFMLRENLPINGVMDRWSTTDYPEDWNDYRTKWFAMFRYRQVVLLAGFVSLLVGAVCR